MNNVCGSLELNKISTIFHLCIANALMKKIDEISKELNTIGIRLYVNLDNNEAIPLYKKHVYKNKCEAIFMEKEQME